MLGRGRGRSRPSRSTWSATTAPRCAARPPVVASGRSGVSGMTQVPVRCRPRMARGLGQPRQSRQVARESSRRRPASRRAAGRPPRAGRGRPSGPGPSPGRPRARPGRGPGGRPRRSPPPTARSSVSSAERSRPERPGVEAGEHRRCLLPGRWRSASRRRARRRRNRPAVGVAQRLRKPLRGGPGPWRDRGEAFRIELPVRDDRTSRTRTAARADEAIASWWRPGSRRRRRAGTAGRSGRGCGRRSSSARTRSRPTRRSGSRSRPTTSRSGPLPAYWIENKGVNSLWHVPIPPQAVGARLHYRSAARSAGSEIGLQPVPGHDRPPQPARPDRVGRDRRGRAPRGWSATG